MIAIDLARFPVSSGSLNAIQLRLAPIANATRKQKQKRQEEERITKTKKKKEEEEQEQRPTEQESEWRGSTQKNWEAEFPQGAFATRSRPYENIPTIW